MLKNMNFRLKECLEVLGNKISIINDEKEKDAIIKQMIKKFPPTSWGRIDWTNISKKQLLISENNILSSLKEAGKTACSDVYIVWHEADRPIVKCELINALNNLYDVLEVSFDTWLYCPSEGWVVEFHHDGDIMLGFE